jgi:hypothetical protein
MKYNIAIGMDGGNKDISSIVVTMETNTYEIN